METDTICSIYYTYQGEGQRIKLDEHYQFFHRLDIGAAAGKLGKPEKELEFFPMMPRMGQGGIPVPPRLTNPLIGRICAPTGRTVGYIYAR